MKECRFTSQSNERMPFYFATKCSRSEWKLPLRGRITYRYCWQPKLPNFLYLSNRLFGGGAADAGSATPTFCLSVPAISKLTTLTVSFQIGAGLYAVGRPFQKRNDEDGQIGTIQSLPLERGASFNRFFGEPAHGPPHVAGGASGPIGGCRDESRTDNPDLDLRHEFDRNNRKTDLI